MNPDTEILASLDLDWILSPSSLESDLQPKYAAIKTKSAFLNLKSVEGMYESIEELGEMFDRQEQAQKLVDEYTSFMDEYKNKNKGKDISQVKLKDFARQVAIVHQYNTAPADISVEKLVAFGRTPYHSFGSLSNSEEDEEKIKRALEITNTEKLKDKAVTQLSGGQKQRVWIAMALAQDTKILFLDEPTTYLDIRYQLQILKLVRKLNEEYGMTVIMVLHDINQSLYYSDEIVAMKDGRITAQGKPEEIITSELIKNVYDVELGISAVNGKPFVLPV